jgi:hypothetical protein
MSISKFAILSPGLQQQHSRARVLAQAAGQNAAGRTGPHGHVVVHPIYLPRRRHLRIGCGDERNLRVARLYLRLEAPVAGLTLTLNQRCGETCSFTHLHRSKVLTSATLVKTMLISRYSIR